MADEKLSEQQVADRRDDALRRALSTPPKPKTESTERKDKEPKKGKSAK